MLTPPTPQLVVHVRNEQHNDPPRRYIHDRHHLAVLLRGAGTYANGPVVLPAPPTISFNPAGEPDVNGLVGPVEGWYVGFDWPTVAIAAPPRNELILTAVEGGAGGGAPLHTPRVKALDAAGAAQVAERFTALHAAAQRQDAVGRLAAAGCLGQLLALFFDLPQGAAAAPGHRALVRFRDLLIRHACDPIGIAALADRAGASADHLRDLFRAAYGQRPVEFRTGVRLSRARELLAGGTRSIGAVARAVGYPDALYFSRAFRKQFGLAPRDIVRRYRAPI
ncbi:MAG: helix-turn-helix transcriptional regulator [Planctomycetota bacterium]